MYMYLTYLQTPKKTGFCFVANKLAAAARMLLLWWLIAKGRKASETSVLLSWLMAGMSSCWFIIYMWSGFCLFGKFAPLMVIRCTETPAGSQHKGTFSYLLIWNRLPQCSEELGPKNLHCRYQYETQKSLNCWDQQEESSADHLKLKSHFEKEMLCCSWRFFSKRSSRWSF